MPKFTFKKEKAETGPASVGNPHPSTQIKLNKKQCGTISPPNWRTEDSSWRIRLTIKDGPFDFQWITLKHKTSTEEKAREFIRKYNDQIIEKYDLHFFED